jgi:hypothetical protein
MSKYGAGNYGHYRGTMSAVEQIRRAQEADKARFENLAYTLIDAIGKKAYDEIVDDWPENFTWAEACQWIENELDNLECSCTPDKDIPCLGCRTYYKGRESDE